MLAFATSFTSRILRERKTDLFGAAKETDERGCFFFLRRKKPLFKCTAFSERAGAPPFAVHRSMLPAIVIAIARSTNG